MSSVIINQSPTLPNGTQADVIYTLQSVNSAEPQYKYVCQIKDDVGNILSQVKQVPNNNGYAVFEVSRLLDDHMGYDLEWKTSVYATSSNNNIRNFEIAFGEEYGSSISSSLTSSIDVSASVVSNTTFIPAVQERDSGMFNWDSSSYDALTNAPNVVTALNDATKHNALVVSSSDYLTLSSLNGIGPKGTLESVNYRIYQPNFNVSYHTKIDVNITPTNVEDKLIHIPAGPANLIAINESFEALLLTYKSQYPYYSLRLNYSGGHSDLQLFNNAECFNFEGRNFAFINKQGVFDYYRATLVDRQRESFNRKTYKAPYIDYSTTSGVVDYSYSRRGDTQYYASFENKFEVETDWLNTAQADWLFELFESPSVFVQQGSEFVGIIIENASEEYRTNPAGQRMFKYTIKYRLSNSKRSRT